MKTDIRIVDRGRGPQLSSSRITVQDLVPYFQEGSTYDEIIRWIPTLTHEEIAVAECYYRQHKAKLLEQDCRIRAHRDEQIRSQQIRLPVDDRPERLQRMRDLLRKRLEEQNGEGYPG
jgi:uncharacterized protein (DUF433 family)